MATWYESGELWDSSKDCCRLRACKIGPVCLVDANYIVQGLNLAEMCLSAIAPIIVMHRALDKGTAIPQVLVLGLLRETSS